MRDWQYFEWDFGRKVVTEWARSGECNRCGDCCRARISYTFGGDGTGLWAQMGKTIGNDQGVWLEARSGNLRWFIGEIKIDETDHKHACPLITKDVCKAHKQKARKAPLCETWPIHPSQVEVFGRCSYKFEKVSEESFE